MVIRQLGLDPNLDNVNSENLELKKCLKNIIIFKLNRRTSGKGFPITIPGTLEAGAMQDPTPHVQSLQDKNRLGADAAGVGAAANGRDLATPAAR